MGSVDGSVLTCMAAAIANLLTPEECFHSDQLVP